MLPGSLEKVHRDLKRSPEGVALDQVRSVLPRMIWPTRFYRRLRHCKEEGQRQKLEEDERDRQIGKLVVLLKKIGLIEDGDDRPAGPSGAWAVKRHALGRRANTLRIHVRLGERMGEYAMRTHGVEWFRNVAEIMDYVAGRLEEPCGKTVPNSIYSTVKFLELSAELPVQRRMGSDQALENFINEVNRSQFWAAKPRISANKSEDSVDGEALHVCQVPLSQQAGIAEAQPLRLPGLPGVPDRQARGAVGVRDSGWGDST